MEVRKHKLPIYGEKVFLMGRKQLQPEKMKTYGYTGMPSLDKQLREDAAGIPVSVIIRKLIVFYHTNKTIIDTIEDPAGWVK